jgi:hypothetical protein
MVRHRSVALVTRDPGLYHELAGFLRERRLPSVSLLPGERIPESVAVVLTSVQESAEISHPRVLPVAEGADRRALGAAVAHALGLGGPGEQTEIVVGIDPGPRPGYAILSAGISLAEGVLDTPEAVEALAVQIRHHFPSRHVLFRVGSGDPPARNRIVNALLQRRRSVELVDETGTTPRGRRRPRDALAARQIGAAPGEPVREPLVAAITPGEIANVQRLSREGSGGRVTISRSSAHRVLRGEVSLAEAVDQAIGRGSPPGERREPRSPRQPL